MEPDKYQRAWQARSSQTRVAVDADLLRKEVQRNQRDFRAMIFWGDVGEVWIYILLVPLWIYLGVTTSSPWTWYLTVPALIWGAGSLLAYRMRPKREPSMPDEPLFQCVRRSLTELEDEVWLRRNAFWRSSLPLGISILTFSAHNTWLRSEDWRDAVGHAGVFVFVFAVFGFVYFLGRHTVRSKYEPRRQDLLTLLMSLRDETIGKGAGDPVALPDLPFTAERRRTPCGSPGRVTVGLIAFAAVTLFLSVIAMMLVNTDRSLITGEGYPKRSPFAAVRWQESQPEVKVGNEWYRLVSLDGMAAEEIVAFSRRTYGDLWRKRFEEDLVELLTRIGRPPPDEVTLVVQSLESSEVRTLEGVPLTEANRRAIYRANSEAAEDREREE